MSFEILMPALSPTMTDGNLVKWLIKEGDKVNAGDVIAEIETDKATMEVETADEGIVKELLFKEGSESIKVNTPIAIIEEESSEERNENVKKKSDIEIIDTKEDDGAVSSKHQKEPVAVSPKEENSNINQQFRICPTCSSKSLKMENGCDMCVECGYSKCDK